MSKLSRKKAWSPVRRTGTATEAARIEETTLRHESEKHRVLRGKS